MRREPKKNVKFQNSRNSIRTSYNVQ